MDASASHLSLDTYRYDFVISTTQASINSNLWQYLALGTQPVQYFCYNEGETGYEQVDYDEVVKTTGVDPFTLGANPDVNGTPVKNLWNSGFAVGIKIQMGLPRGLDPKTVAAKYPIVVLEDGATNVTFNMYCKQLSGDAWYIPSKVNIKGSTLENNLDTPWFIAHPAEKAAMLEKLKTGTAYSLQQLLIDLDTAAVNGSPTAISSNSNAPIPEGISTTIGNTYLSIYRDDAKQNGHPLLAVLAVVDDGQPDPSQLQLTYFQRQVNKLKDANGNEITVTAIDPVTKVVSKESNAATLDYLCVANNHSFPGFASFPWNWVDPDDVDSQSGTISINRNTMANFIMNEILPECSKSCLVPTCGVSADAFGTVNYNWDLASGATPKLTTITPTGDTVIQISYTDEAFASDRAGATYGELKIGTTYTCDVTFKGSQVTVAQHLLIPVYLQWDSTSDGCNAVDKYITDTYTLVVNDYGRLTLHAEETLHVVTDKSESPSSSDVTNFFTHIRDVVNYVKGFATNFAAVELQSVPFDDLPSFIFPGGKVFTLYSPRFSQYQDLLCNIDYVSTDQATVATLQATSNAGSREVVRPSIPDQASRDSQDFTLSSSTDLIQNYIQGEIVAPTSKFEALQTANGHALLFSLDSNGTLHVLEETSGMATTGWEAKDISSGIINTAFPNMASATVRTFEVGQSAINNTINIAMAVSVGGSDHLYLSLSNSSADTSWLSSPPWSQYPFDAASDNQSVLDIENILFAESEDNEQYIVVDINRSISSSVKHIMRYYIDLSKSTGHYWIQHPVPGDIDTGTYQSCIGRKLAGYIDGIYTSGQVAGSSQFIYVPIINVWGGGPPPVTRLNLPGNVIPTAIATSRITDQSSDLWGNTDLYAVGGSTLYRFPADGQGEGAIGKPIVTSQFVTGTETLAAMTHEGVTTVWGKNSSNEVYYIACPTTQLAIPTAWSAPVPILSGVERMSAFINTQDGGNTIFASGGGKLQRLMQSTDTASKIWRAHDIKLTANPNTKPLEFKAYTTTIRVTDADNQPVANADLEISTDSRVPVYINGLYYLLSATPVRLKTDAVGSLTIVEATNDLNSAQLFVSVTGGVSVSINPMAKSFAKLATLNSTASLRNASFPSQTTAGGVLGPTENTLLVSSSTSDKDAGQVVDAMNSLKTVYDQLEDSSLSQARVSHPRVVPTALFAASPLGLDTDIAVAAGDFFQFLSQVPAGISIVKNGITNAWEAVLNFGNTVYRTVLDTLDAVVGAVTWIFNAISTKIDDLIRYVEFLFDWDDIRRTKDVIHNVVKLYLVDQIERVKSTRDVFDQQIGSAKQVISQWAGITDWSSLGEIATKPASKSASNPAEGQTSGSQLLSDHFRDNAKDLTVLSQEPSLDVAQNLVDDVMAALYQQGEVLSTVYKELQQLAIDLGSLNVGDILKKIVGLLADSALDGVQAVVDALFNAIVAFSNSAVTLLDTKIHVPVVSDILNAIGVTDISFLDLFTWIGAVSFTIPYKLVRGKAPFSDNSEVRALISAANWSDLRQLCGQTGEAATLQTPSKLAESRTALTVIPLSDETKESLYNSCHTTASLIQLPATLLNALEAAAPTSINNWSTMSTIVSAMAAGFQSAGDTLVPVEPTENKAVLAISGAATGLDTVVALVFSGPAQAKFRAAQGSKFSGLAVGDGRATGAIVKAVMTIPVLVKSAWHFYELSGKPVGIGRSSAIVGEVSNVTAALSKVAYAVAVNDDDPESRAITIGVMVVVNLATAGLRLAESALYE
ncbi:hypothetical protein F5Y03DRAFT_406560 [Xylaria venustula]|nr:hypothetical protein F5Y03DRAFT_406560 [Xylaria venustula]